MSRYWCLLLSAVIFSLSFSQNITSLNCTRDPSIPEDYVRSTYCLRTKVSYKIVPFKSWGNMPTQYRCYYQKLGCPQYFLSKRIALGKISFCKNTSLPLNNRTLVAIISGSTTRGIDEPSLKQLSLFSVMLPSLIRSLDCPFRYLCVIGYDTGDRFYDNSTVTPHDSFFFFLFLHASRLSSCTFPSILEES
jgi:hypothetical protein